MDDIPSIDQNFPIPSNLCSFKNTVDLIRNNKFPKLADSDLHLIIGIREAELINFEKIRKPCNSNEPFVGFCKLGWTVFGPDQYLKNKPITRCNFVCISDDTLENKVDLLFRESFAEKPHDFNQAPSVNDKIVLSIYKESIKNIGGRYQIELPYKQEGINLPYNHQYALNRMLKLKQRLEKE